MKLLINRHDIIDAFVLKTGFEAKDIEIEMDPLPAVSPESRATALTYKAAAIAHLRDLDSTNIRFAIASIFDEGYSCANGKANRVALIKAVRALTDGTTLTEAGEFVDKVLITVDGSTF